MKTKHVIKALGLLFCLMMGVYISYQAYRFLYPNYTTQTALITEVSDSIHCRGIVVRDETVIGEWGGSARSYLVGDGDKVAMGETVAVVYADTQSAVDAMRYEKLSSELAVVEASADSSRSGATSVSNLTNSIYNNLLGISASLSMGEYRQAAAGKLELLRLMNSYDLAVEDSVSFDGRLSDLRAGLGGLSDTAGGQLLTAPAEGYFISHVDGLEDRVNRETVLSMSTDTIDALAASTPVSDTSRCKIVSGYVWDFAATVDSSMQDRLWVGRSVDLDFRFAGLTGIPAEVAAVTVEEGSDRMVVVFTCRHMNASLASLRCEQAEIRFFDYTGIRIPRSALRVEGGVVGVYVKYGSAVAFKKIEILYENDEYVVSRAGSPGGDVLAIYDEVILQGKDLYVGKEL